jgi:hypothetical protein
MAIAIGTRPKLVLQGSAEFIVPFQLEDVRQGLLGGYTERVRQEAGELVVVRDVVREVVAFPV